MKLITKDTKKIVIVSKNIFNYFFNKTLIHQIIVLCMNNLRQGTHSQKNRSEVSGSKKKPWRQKGTGRARSGNKKSPIWRSGGVTFAAKPKNYKKKINQKMYQNSLKSILSELIRQKRLLLIENINFNLIKTKYFLKKIKSITNSFKNILIIYKYINLKQKLSLRNIYKFKINNVSKINLIDLIFFKKIIITIDAIKYIEGKFNDKTKRKII